MHERRTQASLLACVFYYTIKAEREVKEMDYYNNPYMARYQSLQMPEMFRWTNYPDKRQKRRRSDN